MHLRFDHVGFIERDKVQLHVLRLVCQPKLNLCSARRAEATLTPGARPIDRRLSGQISELCNWNARPRKNWCAAGSLTKPAMAVPRIERRHTYAVADISASAASEQG